MLAVVFIGRMMFGPESLTAGGAHPSTEQSLGRLLHHTRRMDAKLEKLTTALERLQEQLDEPGQPEPHEVAAGRPDRRIFGCSSSTCRGLCAHARRCCCTSRALALS